ncbi:MAG: hypothetical protein ACT6U0_22275, partial [Shinella sp.]
MQDLQGKWPGLKALRYGLLLAVSVATLSGCVSAASTDMRADNKATQESEDSVAEGSTEETTTPVVTAGATGGAAQDASVTADAGTTGQQTTGEAGSDMAGLVMQPTSLNAGKVSIYSNGNQATPTSNAYATQTSGTNGAVNSLYANSGAAQTADQSGRLPVEDMPAVDSTTQQPVATLGDYVAAAESERPRFARTKAAVDDTAKAPPETGGAW